MNNSVRFLFFILLGVTPFYALGGVFSGSGFFITQDGYFVTNYHVVRDAEKIQLRNMDGNLLRAVTVRIDKANDLAVLKAEGAFHHLSIANSRSARRGVRVITVGYPHIDVQGIEPKVTEGIINSLSGIGDDPRVFQISAPVQSGNSGGPLVTDDGNVVGIVVSKLSAKTMFNETGDLPQNVNYAVKSNYLSEMVSTISGIEGKLKSPNKKEFGNLADLASHVEKATAIVIAEDVADETKKQRESIDKEPTPGKTAQAGLPPPLRGLIDSIRAGQYSSYGIGILAPDTAEIGAVVPLEVRASSPLIHGEKLYVIVNDEYISHIVAPQGSIEVRRFSARSRMPQTGYLRALIVDQSGKIRTASKEVHIKYGADMKSSDRGNSFSHKSRATKKDGDAEIKFLITSPMSELDFLKSMEIKYEDYGGVVIEMTPAATKNPFIGVTTNSGDFNDFGVDFHMSNGDIKTGRGAFR